MNCACEGKNGLKPLGEVKGIYINEGPFSLIRQPLIIKVLFLNSTGNFSFSSGMVGNGRELLSTHLLAVIKASPSGVLSFVSAE